MRAEQHQIELGAIENAVVEMMGDEIFQPGFLFTGFTEIETL